MPITPYKEPEIPAWKKAIGQGLKWAAALWEKIGWPQEAFWKASEKFWQAATGIKNLWYWKN